MGLATGYTKTMSVSNSGLGTPVIAVTACRKITVGEDPSVSGWPTVDYQVYRPDYNSTPRQVSTGLTYTFESAGFIPGQTVGYIKAIGSASTFFQDESDK